MVYNEEEHKMLFYLIPYGDWYILLKIIENIGSTTLSRTGIDTHKIALVS